MLAHGISHFWGEGEVPVYLKIVGLRLGLSTQCLYYILGAIRKYVIMSFKDSAN